MIPILYVGCVSEKFLHWCVLVIINPLVTNGFSHPYHLDESIVIFRGVRSNFSFLFHFSMKILSANRIAPDGAPRLRRHIWGYSVCLCRKKDARLIWVKRTLVLNPVNIHFSFSINLIKTRPTFLVLLGRNL